MKRIFTLTALFCFTALFSIAQFEPGRKVLGGNINFSTGKSENVYGSGYTTNYRNIGISPTLGWFKKSNQLVGVGLSYGYNYNRNSYQNNNNTVEQNNNN